MKPIMKKYITEGHHIYTVDRLLVFVAICILDVCIRLNFELYGIYYNSRRQEEFIMNILKELVLVDTRH